MLRRSPWLLLSLLAACSEYDLAAPDSEFCNGPDGATTLLTDEVCDGIDNDCDEVIDEGFDADSDGTADCFDNEACDGLDNDGDSNVDEGFDVDADGTPDCEDAEECDGVDNDGNAQVDEGFDSDTDGTPDCADTEECDSLDNDGDLVIDEGFDADGDGTPDCIDLEVCDGADNNGDGYTDEGFTADTDGDGTLDCIDAEECDGIDNDGDLVADNGFDLDGDGVARCCEPGEHVLYYPQRTVPPFTLVNGRRSNGDGTFQPAALFEAIDSNGADMRVLTYGNVDEPGGDTNADVFWYRVSDKATFTTTCLDGEWQTIPQGTLGRGPTGWGDFNADGCIDYVSYDYRSGNFGDFGDTGLGYTMLGACDGTFTQMAASTFDVLFLDNLWTGGMPYNLADWNGDGHVDLFFWAVANGGTTPSLLWYLPGNGDGTFDDQVALTTFNQAANSGAMGDVDGDGCVDFVNGANDDGTAGSVWAVFGNCAGGSKTPRMLVNQGTYATANGQGVYGDGQSRLWDFDSDGDLDLVTSFNRTANNDGAILYWDNDGAGFFTNGTSTDPAAVIVPMWGLTNVTFLVPQLD